MKKELELLKEKADLLMKCSDLEFYPIGIKFAKNKDDVPDDVIFPYRDRKEKWAVCQLTQKSRHENVSYGMTVEDHWCWYPIISHGHRELKKGNEDYTITLNNVGIPQKDKEEKFVEKIPHLPLGSNYATLIGPINVISYMPDIIQIYTPNAQVLRRLIGAIKYMDGDMLETELDYVNSCCWGMIPTQLTRKFRVTIPDPGEYERAEIGANELILTVPVERFNELCDVMDLKEKRFKLRPNLHTGLVPYFKRAQFMNDLYRIWGLETDDENISWTEEQRGYETNK